MKKTLVPVVFGFFVLRMECYVDSMPLPTLHNNIPNKFNTYVREKRQSGYNYNRPSVAFNLPNRTPGPGPSTQPQMMYYAYPGGAPLQGGGQSTINVQTPGSTTGSQGYSYGAPTSTQGPTTSGGYSAQTGSTIGSSSVTYPTYNTPGSSVSTSGPEYLPPANSPTSSSGYSSTSTPSSTTTGATSAGYNYTPGSTFVPPGQTYLPPGTTSAPSSSPGYSSPTPTTPGYSSPAPTPGQTVSVQTGYLPPGTSTSTQSVSTPAPSYLPPV